MTTVLLALLCAGLGLGLTLGLLAVAAMLVLEGP